jgi:hypothetical protein
VFEGETFLVMAKSGSPLDAAELELDEWESERGVGRLDRQRFEKVSEIIKSFRRTCQRTGSSSSASRPTLTDVSSCSSRSRVTRSCWSLRPTRG